MRRNREEEKEEGLSEYEKDKRRREKKELKVIDEILDLAQEDEYNPPLSLPHTPTDEERKEIQEKIFAHAAQEFQERLRIEGDIFEKRRIEAQEKQKKEKELKERIEKERIEKERRVQMTDKRKVEIEKHLAIIKENENFINNVNSEIVKKYQICEKLGIDIEKNKEVIEKSRNIISDIQKSEESEEFKQLKINVKNSYIKMLLLRNGSLIEEIVLIKSGIKIGLYRIKEANSKIGLAKEEIKKLETTK